jgi:hypothetical protein
MRQTHSVVVDATSPIALITGHSEDRVARTGHSARGLNPPAPRGAWGFDSLPGHTSWTPGRLVEVNCAPHAHAASRWRRRLGSRLLDVLHHASPHFACRRLGVRSRRVIQISSVGHAPLAKRSQRSSSAVRKRCPQALRRLSARAGATRDVSRSESQIPEAIAPSRSRAIAAALAVPRRA